MNRRKFIKKTALTAAASIVAPYILPTGRLFANTGARLANHVVFVLFGGGLRNQETVGQQYLANQGLPTQGNIMNNMLVGNAPTSNIVYDQWSPILGIPISQQGTLFSEMTYAVGPTGHYNGHTVAMTGNYTETGLNLNVNPEHPTIFEYYRKHSDPNASALNAWWLSEGLGPYPSLNYSQHFNYGPTYGANYMNPSTVFSGLGNTFIGNAVSYQPDDVERVQMLRQFLDNNFDQTADVLPGINNTPEEREMVKNMILNTIAKVTNGTADFPTPTGSQQGLTGDLINIFSAWEVMETFKPELMVINTFNSDACHDNFSAYVNFLHKADYGVGWLWNKIQNDPVLANDTIMICMPEHGRNEDSNNVIDANGLGAYDHTGDANSRRLFSLIVGPPGVVVPNQVIGSQGNPVGESVDIIPTIAKILGIYDDIPSLFLPGNPLDQAFI